MKASVAQEKSEGRCHQHHRKNPWLGEFEIEMNLAHNRTLLSRLGITPTNFSLEAFTNRKRTPKPKKLLFISGTPARSSCKIISVCPFAWFVPTSHLLARHCRKPLSCSKVWMECRCHESSASPVVGMKVSSGRRRVVAATLKREGDGCRACRCSR